MHELIIWVLRYNKRDGRGRKVLWKQNFNILGAGIIRIKWRLQSRLGWIFFLPVLKELLYHVFSNNDPNSVTYSSTA